MNNFYRYRNINTFCKLLLALLISFYSYNALALSLPRSNPVPGGIAIIPLDTESSVPPVVRYQGNRVMVTPDSKKQNHWLAITGIPLSAEPGKHILEIEQSQNDESKKLNFTVKKKKYKTQHLTIKNKRKVNPNKKDMERIGREKEKITSALANFRDSNEVNTDFVIPVKGRLSSPFGLKRFFNKQPRKPHSGIDIAAPEGTPIVSPAAGVVIDVGNYFFNGNSIFIDHGQGLITMYCHMSKVLVKNGQKVEKGQKIGAIGKTGRVTGPHLHWAVSLNDARVDPGLFFDSLQKAARGK